MLFVYHGVGLLLSLLMLRRRAPQPSGDSLFKQTQIKEKLIVLFQIHINLININYMETTTPKVKTYVGIKLRKLNIQNYSIKMTNEINF